MEKSKSAIIGQVGFLITEVPFPNHSSVIARPVHQLGQGRAGGVEIPPVAFRVLTNHSGRAHQIGIATGHQRSPGGGADGTVGVELVQAQARVHQVVNGGGSDVLASEGGKIAVTQVIDEDAEDVGFLARKRAG